MCRSSHQATGMVVWCHAARGSSISNSLEGVLSMDCRFRIGRTPSYFISPRVTASNADADRSTTGQEPDTSEAVMPRGLPAPVLTELRHAARARLETRYGSEVMRLAERWNTSDFPSVDAIFTALELTALEPDRPIPEAIDPSGVFLFRNTEARFLNMDARTIGNNPRPCAVVRNDHTLELTVFPEERYAMVLGDKAPRSGDRYTERDRQAVMPDGRPWSPAKLMMLKAKRARADSPEIGGGINFAVSLDPHGTSVYPGSHAIRCSLADVLGCGGRIYYDNGGAFRNSVLVNLPGQTRIPFDLMADDENSNRPA
jgi:hypothetical protein